MTDEKRWDKAWLKRHKDLIWGAAAILFIYVVFHFAGIGCPIKFVTGISCLGCGMTRAWLSLLKLDFAAAFYYHPLYAVPPLAILVYLLKSKINIKIYKIKITKLLFKTSLMQKIPKNKIYLDRRGIW